MASREFKVGLIGYGAVASYGHLPAIRATPGLTAHAVLDPDPARREQAVRDGARRATADADEFLDAGLDALVVTSPAHLHREHVLMAAGRRLPTLCEKPLAMTEAEGEAMIKAMGAAGAPLFVGFTYRFSPAALAIHRLVREGAIGAVRDLRLVYNWDCHGKHDPRTGRDALNARREGRMVEGGPMVDCGVHQIDLARWWLGADVVRQHGVGVWVDDDHDAPDHLYLHLDHAGSDGSAAGGAHTLVEISFSHGHTAVEPRSHFVFELIGTDGLIRYDRERRLFEVVNRGGVRPLAFSPEKDFGGMYAAFADALASGDPGPLLPTARDGLIATRIARTATEQAVRDRAFL